MREAGLIDAPTHREVLEQFKNMPEVEVDVKMIHIVTSTKTPNPLVADDFGSLHFARIASTKRLSWPITSCRPAPKSRQQRVRT